jgi:hypothetical protein
VIQLLSEAPDFAHPLLLRACLARPDDREPAMPKGHHDTPERRTYTTWIRRRWGYLTAVDDPEAQRLWQRLEGWASAPDRAYLRSADLRLLFARLGVEQSDVGYFELLRLVDLCTALDELALRHPTLEAPPEMSWAALGWPAHHSKRRHGVVDLDEHRARSRS